MVEIRKPPKSEAVRGLKLGDIEGIKARLKKDLEVMNCSKYAL